MVHIITNPTKEILVPPMRGGDQLEGWFKIEITKPDGRTYVAADWQKNLITNAGMNNFGISTKNGYVVSTQGWFHWCHVGSGTATPQFTDTALQSPIGTPAPTSGRTFGAAQDELDGPPYYRWQRETFTFSQGQAAGTWREIGIGPNVGLMYGISTRALIVDGNGDPTSIVVGPSDQVTVTYELRTYITQLTHINEQFVIDSVLYDTKRIPFAINNPENMNGTFRYGGGITSLYMYKGTSRMPNVVNDPWDAYNPDSMGNATGVLQSYGAGTYYLDSVLTATYNQYYWGPKGLTGFRMGGMLMKWMISFTQNLDPTWGIPKNNTNELVMTFRHTWARYTPP